VNKSRTNQIVRLGSWKWRCLPTWTWLFSWYYAILMEKRGWS